MQVVYIPKRYGESKLDACPFCGESALTRSNEGVPVCARHKDRALPALKCACGAHLESKQGKFGLFFVCERCGTKSLRQVTEVNPQLRAASARSSAYLDEGKFVRSDDPRFEFR